MPVTEAGEGHLYNGAVEALTTLTGAALSFALGYARLNWALVGEPALFVTSAVGGAVLVLMAGTEDIWVAYAGYAIFRALYQMMITVARLSCMCTTIDVLAITNPYIVCSFEVARSIGDSSYGLVFGFNTFVALLFQTALTLAVADDALWPALAPRSQFVVYGAYWIAIAVLFLAIFGVSVARLDGGAGYLHRCRTEGLWRSKLR